MLFRSKIHDSSIVDFGSHLTQSSFEAPLYRWIEQDMAEEVRRAAVPLITAGEMPQPDPCYAVNFSAWGDPQDRAVCNTT